jgi:hypothetical protein
VRYPFVLFEKNVNHQPFLPNLTRTPFVTVFSTRDADLLAMGVRDHDCIQRCMDRRQGERSWGLGDDLHKSDCRCDDLDRMASLSLFSAPAVPAQETVGHGRRTNRQPPRATTPRTSFPGRIDCVQ